ncbi:hypothetical protein JVU11DRAFT_8887 [Chiua virens]|nr:hypothetical protein JVU11DRAFT_8887 [Chiua virens]
MFTSYAACQHVICLITAGCNVTIWHYDYQNAIKTSKLDFIQDLPHFLVLLLVMQWFKNHDWGLHPKIDSCFSDPLECLLDSQVVFHDPEKGPVILDCSPMKQLSHYGLNGHVTNLCSASVDRVGLTEDLVVKLYWDKESHTSKAEILHRANEIADVKLDVKDHVPEMVATHKISNSSIS